MVGLLAILILLILILIEIRWAGKGMENLHNHKKVKKEERKTEEK